jgi:hypothetical protein
VTEPLLHGTQIDASPQTAGSERGAELVQVEVVLVELCALRASFQPVQEVELGIASGSGEEQIAALVSFRHPLLQTRGELRWDWNFALFVRLRFGQAANNEPDPNSKSNSPALAGPFDAYVSPDMKSYTKTFRFGHQLLIPTRVGNVPAKLFLIDSGGFETMIDPAIAREVTKVRGDDNTTIKGISGSVKNVFSADKAVLMFGHLRQENQDVVSFDMTSISDSAGTEISGALGFTTLHWLDLKIDYRDGLVDLSYDANRPH